MKVGVALQNIERQRALRARVTRFQILRGLAGAGVSLSGMRKAPGGGEDRWDKSGCRVAAVVAALARHYRPTNVELDFLIRCE